MVLNEDIDIKDKGNKWHEIQEGREVNICDANGPHAKERYSK